MHHLKQILIAIDQLFNTLFFGWADETLSSKCYRLKRDGVRSWPCNLIDTLFFWDRDKATGKKHCELSYLSEVKRNQLPPEMRVR